MLNNKMTIEGRAAEFKRLVRIAKGLTPSWVFKPINDLNINDDQLVDLIAQAMTADMSRRGKRAIKGISNLPTWQVVANEIRPDATELIQEALREDV